jgi:hypothetical protein
MNKLAIVGSGPHTRELAPYDDNSFNIWVFNEAPMNDWCRRWDAAFQLHKPEIYTGENVKSAGYWEWLQQPREQKTFMFEVDKRVPGCEKIQIDELIKLGGYKFFGMSICYAVALALLQGYKHIELWGIELSATEYQYGVDSWFYWAGLATGMLGTDHFILHSGEKLFNAPLYGIEGGSQIESKFFADRVTFLDNGWKSAEKHLKNMKDLLFERIEDNEYEKVIQTFTDFEAAAINVGDLAGALGEAEKWIGVKDWVTDRNMFEAAAAKAQMEGDDKRTQMIHNGGMVEYVAVLWAQSKDPRAATQLKQFIERHGQLAYDTGALHGAFIENRSYMSKYDDLMLANGIKIKDATPAIQAVLRHE